MTLVQGRQPIGLSIVIDRAALGGRGRGIFFMSADDMKAGDVNRMARYGGGVVSVALAPARAFELGLSPMVSAPPSADRPYFIASIEAEACTETGISAAERALTIAELARSDAKATDFRSPGHVMPLVVPENVTEVSLPVIALRFSRMMAGSNAAAWCDILDASGEVASADDCHDLASQLAVPIYARQGDTAVELHRLSQSRTQPSLPVKPGGLDIGQFA